MTSLLANLDRHPFEKTVDAIAVALAGLPAEARQVENNVRLAPEFYFSWDTAQSEVSIKATPCPPGLIQLSVTISGSPRWLSMNIGLGNCDFEPGAVLGVVMAGRCGKALEFKVFVRSVSAKTKEADTVLASPLRLGPDQPVAVTLHTVEPEDPLATGERYHTLFLTLPRQSFDFDLVGLRVFAIKV